MFDGIDNFSYFQCILLINPSQEQDFISSCAGKENRTPVCCLPARNASLLCGYGESDPDLLLGKQPFYH